MRYGTTGNVIEKSSAFGLSLSNGASAMGSYTLFLITISWTDSATGTRYTSYPFIRGQNARTLCIMGDYWYEINTTLSTNTFSVSIRRTSKLASSTGTTVTATIRNIQGLG